MPSHLSTGSLMEDLKTLTKIYLLIHDVKRDVCLARANFDTCTTRLEWVTRQEKTRQEKNLTLIGKHQSQGWSSLGESEREILHVIADSTA
jgi:hypothetical protein